MHLFSAGAHHGPTMWAGTNSGSVFAYALEVPAAAVGGEKRPEQAVEAVLGKEVQLMHRAPVVAIAVLDGRGRPLPEPYEASRDLAQAPDMQGGHAVLIASEEQFKVSHCSLGGTPLQAPTSWTPLDPLEPLPACIPHRWDPNSLAPQKTPPVSRELLWKNPDTPSACSVPLGGQESSPISLCPTRLLYPAQIPDSSPQGLCLERTLGLVGIPVS